MKRITALILALLTTFALASCGTQNADAPQDATQTSSDGKVFSQPTTVTLAIGSHASWPYDSEWKVWDYIEEATGVTLDIGAIPESDYLTKVNLMLAAQDQMPDLLHMTDKNMADKQTSSGAFICLSDNMDKLPNYSEQLEKVTPPEYRENIINQRIAYDGKIYFLPAWGNEAAGGRIGWLYRKDVFEKNNMKIPENMDELYEICKQFKQMHPDSYPLIFREGLPKLDFVGASWKKYFSSSSFYDFDEGKWYFGAQLPAMREIVEYFKKLSSEGLIPPDFMTINTKTWEEFISTDRGFVTMDYVGRIDFFNIANRTRDPEYTWALMEPPIANSENGHRKVGKLDTDFTGYLVCNTGKQERIDNAIKLLDWFYTDEAYELLSWGKQGETYNIDDTGAPEYILEENDSPSTKYGFSTLGAYTRFDPKAADALYTKELSVQMHTAADYVEAYTNPTRWLALTDEEAARVADLSTEARTYVEEQVSKFLLDQQPLSMWDEFQKNLESMNVSELLDIYTVAYNRTVNSK